MAVTFEYGQNKIRDFKVNVVKGKGSKGKNVVASILINDSIEAIPTKRFWKSLHQRFRYSPNIHKYFEYEEVFQRIVDRASNSDVRWCLEKVDGHKPKLLAITNPNTPMIEVGPLMGVLDEYSAEQKDYSNGVVRSTHTPKVPWHFQVGGDSFINKFIVDTPIDGHGKPAIYVSLLRLVCTNGMVGYSPSFRTELNVGKKNDSIEFSLSRALESFNNEEAYAALQSRVEAAQNSWASVFEVMQLHRTIIKVYGSGNLKGVKQLNIGGETGNTWDDVPVMKQFATMTGDLNKQYGLANIDALSPKKQKTLPAKCTIYDVLNFSSEVGTHHATPEGNRQCQAFCGKIMTSEYDLEGTRETFLDFKDFFIGNEKTAQTMADMQSLSH